jgi:hypothetical protein
MKTFLVSIVLCILCRTALAGGPEIQIQKAHIDEVTIDYRGVVLRVTGTVMLLVPKLEGDDQTGGNAKWVTLPMKSAEIHLLGDELHATSLEGKKLYQQRLLALKGTEQLLQMWGTLATIESGHVTHITARMVGVLVPVKGERRFASDRLEELSEEPKPK